MARFVTLRSPLGMFGGLQMLRLGGRIEFRINRQVNRRGADDESPYQIVGGRGKISSRSSEIIYARTASAAAMPKARSLSRYLELRSQFTDQHHGGSGPFLRSCLQKE
jgi:hypothetical protein